MPILTLQQRMTEIGRIRTGNQVEFTDQRGKKKSRPAKLDTFRLTSPRRDLIEAAAEVFGGTPIPWTNPAGGAEWEVITTAASLEIVVPPGQPVSQWYELWTAGGCQRRCNGLQNVLDMTPCACPQDVEQRLELAQKGEACKATTRLSVILPAIPGLGVWMLESHGYYAATELVGAAEVLSMATARGQLIPARLRLEQREKRIPGKPTNRYAVPVIDLDARMVDLGLQLAGQAPVAALEAGYGNRRPELPATTLPSTSDFRAPTPPAPASAPESAQEPAAAADGSDAQPEPKTAAAPAPAQPAGLTRDQLVAALREAGISLEYAAQVGKHKFDLAEGEQLTDAQRAELLADLAAETPAAAGL